MKQHAFLSVRFALVLALFSAEPFRCGEPMVESIAAEIPPGVMITRGVTAQGYDYLSGGVSSEEREIVKETGKSYNVQIAFAEKRGAYLADVSLVIQGAKGQEIVAVSGSGPLFYIQLPPGDYSVTATYDGATKHIQHLQVVKGRSVRQTLTWDLGEQSEALKH
jgi:hypothetical protein